MSNGVDEQTDGAVAQVADPAAPTDPAAPGRQAPPTGSDDPALPPWPDDAAVAAHATGSARSAVSTNAPTAQNATAPTSAVAPAHEAVSAQPVEHGGADADADEAAASRHERARLRRRVRRASRIRFVGVMVTAGVVVTAIMTGGHLFARPEGAPNDGTAPATAPFSASASTPAAAASVAGATPTRTSSDTPTGSPAAATTGTPGLAPTTPVQLTATALPARATELLAHFERLAGAAVPGAVVGTARLGENTETTPTGLVGRWAQGTLPNGMSVAENNDAALSAGKVVDRPALAGSGGTGALITADGTSRPVPVLSPAQTLMQLQRSGRGACARCAPVVVTGARPTRVHLDTTTGGVDAPAWQYTVAGSSATIVRPALAPAALVQVAPPYRPTLPPAVANAALPLWKVAVGADSRTVSATLDEEAMAEQPGCWRLFAVESTRAVALYATRGTASAQAGCADGRRVSVTLRAPLASRTLLDTYWQRAIPTRE